MLNAAPPPHHPTPTPFARALYGGCPTACTNRPTQRLRNTRQQPARGATAHLQGASDVRQRSLHPVRLLHAYCNRGELMPPHQQLQIRLRDQPVHRRARGVVADALQALHQSDQLVGVHLSAVPLRHQLAVVHEDTEFRPRRVAVVLREPHAEALDHGRRALRQGVDRCQRRPPLQGLRRAGEVVGPVHGELRVDPRREEHQDRDARANRIVHVARGHLLHSELVRRPDVVVLLLVAAVELALEIDAHVPLVERFRRLLEQRRPLRVCGLQPPAALCHRALEAKRQGSCGARTSLRSSKTVYPSEPRRTMRSATTGRVSGRDRP